MTTVVENAREYARKAHGGQFRKDGKTPAITHMDGVVRILRDDLKVENPTVLAAAYLHDTIEDTATTYPELVDQFGEAVADIVEECTRDPDTHRDAYSNHFKIASPEACLIKLADRFYNLCDWNGMDRGYRPKYAAEGMEIVTRILRNVKINRWSPVEQSAAYYLMAQLTAIFLRENGLDHYNLENMRRTDYERIE